jgi:hypothetical protein
MRFFRHFCLKKRMDIAYKQNSETTFVQIERAKRNPVNCQRAAVGKKLR